MPWGDPAGFGPHTRQEPCRAGRRPNVASESSAKPHPQTAGTRSKATRQPTDTLGKLIARWQSLERVYESNDAIARKHEAKREPDAFWYRTQAEILRFRPDPASMPGIEHLCALCELEFDDGFTLRNVRRVHATLVMNSEDNPAAVDSLPFLQAVKDYQAHAAKRADSHHGSEGAAGRQPGGRDESKWTKNRRDFAKPLRATGMSWPAIYEKYNKTKEGKLDKDASPDTIRLACSRKSRRKPTKPTK